MHSPCSPDPCLLAGLDAQEAGAPPCTAHTHLILASWQALMLAKMLPGSQVDSPANRTSTSRWP